MARWALFLFSALSFVALNSALLQRRFKRQTGASSSDAASEIAAMGSVGKSDLEALKSELEYMIHENFLELEAKTEIFLTRHIKEKYEKKFERTMEEMTEQIFNLTNEIDGLNRRCSCLRGGSASGAVPSSDAWERDIRRRAQFACNNMAVTASNCSDHKGKVFGLCDNDGWLTFHRSFGNSELFTSKNWAQYRQGFGQAGGNTEAEFWLGLEALNRITKANSRFQLMIRGTFKNEERNGEFAGKSGWIVYDQFTIDNEFQNYAIHIGPILDHYGFSRVTEFDPIHDVTKNPERKLDGSAFSTWDSDNDLTSANCADTYDNIGWWFNACYHVCFTQKNPFWYDGEKLQYFEKVEMLVKDVGGSAGRK